MSVEAGISEAMGAGAGGATTLYLPGGQELRLDAQTGQITATRYYAFAGQAVAMRTGPDAQDVTSLITDPQGTATIAITNNTTNDLTIRRLDPYGNPRGQATPWPGDRGFLNKPTDTTGLSVTGARYYDPTLGRFISVDPVMDLADPQQWAAYNYANNNPTTYSDPTGLRPQQHDGSASKASYTPSATRSPMPSRPTPPTTTHSYNYADKWNRTGPRRTLSAGTITAPVPVMAVSTDPEQVAINQALEQQRTEIVMLGQELWQQSWYKWVRRVDGAVRPAVPLLVAGRALTMPARPGPVPGPAPVTKPSGAPDRTSAAYVNVRRTDGSIDTVGSRPGAHAEDVAQSLEPGGQMSRPFAWRRDPDTGRVTWRPIDVCTQCQPKYPRELFPPGTQGAPGGAWDEKGSM